PSAPPVFAPAPISAAPASSLPVISPTPLPPLPDFGAAPVFTGASRAPNGPSMLISANSHPSEDVEDISVVPLNLSNPARGPKAIMRNAAGKKQPPLNSNEESSHEFVSYNPKAFRSFNRNATRANFKSSEPTEKMWTFSSWKTE
ncbi:hypothetical protein PFISCL1PPCAC_3696, partial [Pristionchus fissidentatus]